MAPCAAPVEEKARRSEPNPFGQENPDSGEISSSLRTAVTPVLYLTLVGNFISTLFRLRTGWRALGSEPPGISRYVELDDSARLGRARKIADHTIPASCPKASWMHIPQA